MNFPCWYIVITCDYYWLIMANTSSFIPIHGLEEDLDLFGPFGGCLILEKTVGISKTRSKSKPSTMKSLSEFDHPQMALSEISGVKTPPPSQRSPKRLHSPEG